MRNIIIKSRRFNASIHCIALRLSLYLCVLQPVNVHSQYDVLYVEPALIDPLTDVRFTCIEVIDARIDTIIGFVHRGLSNTPVQAQLKGSFPKAMQKLLTKALPVDYGKDKLVFIFHDVTIDEVITMSSETAYCTVELEVARRIDTSLYSLGMFESNLSAGGIDVTNGHGRRISKAIEECLIAFNNTDWQNNQGTLIEKNQLKYVYDHRSIPPKGAYASFGQLSRHAPLSGVEFEIQESNPSKFMQYAFVFRGLKKSDIVKYVSDGENIYLLAGKRMDRTLFLKSHHVGKYIYFENRYPDAYMTSFLGLTGALVSNKGRAIILNTDTRRVSEVNEYTVYYLTKDKHPEILKEFRESKRKLPDLENAIIQLNAKNQ